MTMTEKKIDSYRGSARAAGLLFIIGTAAGFICMGLIAGVLGTPDYLAQMAANEKLVLAGGFFELVMGFACACIAIAMYPVLRKYSESLALGAVAFRLMEGIGMIVSVIGIVSLLAVSQGYVKAGPADAAFYQALGTTIFAGYNWVVNVGIVLAFCTGSMLYYYIFLRTRLVPLWLTAWGIIGILLSLTFCMLAMFNLVGADSPLQFLLSVPIMIQEMVLAVWLIVKGFDQSALATLNEAADNVAVRSQMNAMGETSL
jgi:hypothetical protein